MIKWKDYLVYDVTSPSCLRWKVDIFGGRKYSVKAVSSGDVAGCLNKGGYFCVMLKRKTFLAHRIIWEMFTDEELTPKIKIDHLSGDIKDNRFENLRKTSQAINSRNAKMNKRNSTGTAGIYLDKKLNWIAIWQTIEGKQKARSFASNKYGYEEAKRMALDARTQAIEDLNSIGAGYSERHGVCKSL